MAKVRKKSKLSDSELAAIIDSEIYKGIGAPSGEISQDRQDLMDYYLGKPYGNERDGYSKVVTREVFETIEWIKPTLLRIFFAGDTVVEFDPVSPDPADELQARQETEYCNYIFNKENKGFLEGYNWFTDALLQRIGVMKCFREEIVKLTHESYENLNDKEMIDLIDEKNRLDDKEFKVEVQEHKFNSDGTIDLNITLKQTVKKTTIQCIPPEQFIVSNRHTSLCLQDVDFCAHIQSKTYSDLVAMGYDEDVIDTLSSDRSLEYEAERINRDDKTDEQYYRDDETDQVYRYEECYIRIDADEDGIAELLQICKVGEKIISNEYFDHIPFTALCSVPLPHKYTGLCVADLVKDIQLIRSTLLRMMLDGMYQSNNPRFLADELNCEISDLLNPASGQVVRGKTGSVTALPIQAGEVMQNVLPAMKTLEDIKESRSGVTRTGRGLDPNVIADATKGAFDRAVDQAQERIEMIARIFAETGVTELFKIIRELGIKNDDSRHIKLGQEWVNVHPRSWKTRHNMSINVGLGTNSKEIEVNILRSIIAKQEQYIGSGSRLADEQKLYHSLSKLVQISGYKSTHLYFNDPSTLPPPPPPKPDPIMVSIEKDFEAQMAKLNQKDREAFMNNLLKLIKLEVENTVDLGPPGIGKGFADEQQRETEQYASSYSSRASAGNQEKGPGGDPAQEQPAPQ